MYIYINMIYVHIFVVDFHGVNKNVLVLKTHNNRNKAKQLNNFFF